MELADFDVVPILNIVGDFSGLEKLVLQGECKDESNLRIRNSSLTKDFMVLELEGVEDLNRDALDEFLIQLSINSPTLKVSLCLVFYGSATTLWVFEIHFLWVM